jgi:hypothetical protein
MFSVISKAVIVSAASATMMSTGAILSEDSIQTAAAEMLTMRLIPFELNIVVSSHFLEISLCFPLSDEGPVQQAFRFQSYSIIQMVKCQGSAVQNAISQKMIGAGHYWYLCTNVLIFQRKFIAMC